MTDLLHATSLELTCFRIHFVFLSRLNQIRQSSLEGVVRAKNINIHHGLECIHRQLFNGSQEVTRRSGAVQRAS